MQHPMMMYGTAWKEAETQRLVTTAIRAGFRAIDTANQRRHYFEEGGRRGAGGVLSRPAWCAARICSSRRSSPMPARRMSGYLTTPTRRSREQLEQSHAKLARAPQTSYLDSYVLHGTHTGGGFDDADWEVWEAMESLVAAKGVGRDRRQQHRHPGPGRGSLVEPPIKPSFVQNRCFARDGWDRTMREYCRSNGIVYQGFSLLTANRPVLARPDFREIVNRTRERTAPQVIFRFAVQVGMSR